MSTAPTPRSTTTPTTSTSRRTPGRRTHGCARRRRSTTTRSTGFWAISRHADVEKALSDWETFSNRRSDILELVNSEFDMPKGVMMFEDPPIHTMLRGLMGRVFTPRRMAEIEDQIRQFCANCLDPHVGSDGFDIIAELGVDDADAGDRHAAGHSGVRPDQGPRRQRREPAHQARRADEGVQRRQDRRRPDLRRLRRVAVEEPVRRSDDGAAQRRVRRRRRA